MQKRKSFIGLLIATIIFLFGSYACLISYGMVYNEQSFGEVFTKLVPDIYKGLTQGFFITFDPFKLVLEGWENILGFVVTILVILFVIYAFIVYIVKKRKRYIPTLLLNVLVLFTTLTMLYLEFKTKLIFNVCEHKHDSMALLICWTVIDILLFLVSFSMTCKGLEVSYNWKRDLAREQEKQTPATNEEKEEVTTSTVEKPVEEVKVEEAPVEETPVEEEPDEETKGVKKIINKVKKTYKKAVNRVTKSGKVYHIAKRSTDGLWTIKFANGKKVIKTFPTKKEAVEYAEVLAANQGATVLTHASKGANKGRIQKK